MTKVNVEDDLRDLIELLKSQSDTGGAVQIPNEEAKKLIAMAEYDVEILTAAKQRRARRIFLEQWKGIALGISFTITFFSLIMSTFVGDLIRGIVLGP